MAKKRNSLVIIIGLLAIFVIIQACSLPIGQKTEAPPEVIVAPEEEKTEEIFLPLVEGSEETEAEAETEAPAEEQATNTPEPPTATPIPHVYVPGEPGWVSKYFFDTDSSTTAGNKSAAGGDDYYSNKYERPFSQTDMVYYPDLDIQKAEISHDDNFYYISITVKGLNPTTGNLTGTFGAELDTDLDGRGDFLFYCDLPNFNEWKIDTVHAFKDTNNDVGGALAMRHDANYSGDGFETLIFSPSKLDDPDGMWCRQRSGGDVKVDLAIHKPLIGNAGAFAWGVWTDLGLKQPGWFDYNDHFTFDQAGSPMAGNSYYPIKEIHSLDSTCREAFGFEPSVEIPGLCFVPTPTPTTPPKPTATPTNTQVPKPGNLRVQLFWDEIRNGYKDATESYYTYATKTFRLSTGNCTGVGIVIGTKSGSAVTWTGLQPGSYCLSVTDMTYITTSMPMPVTIISSTTVNVDVGYYYYLGR